jgi:hypothetical protein
MQETLGELPEIFVSPQVQPRPEVQETQEPTEDEQKVPSLASVSRETAALLEVVYTNVFVCCYRLLPHSVTWSVVLHDSRFRLL